MVSPSGLWQPGAHHALEELPFYQIRVFGTEVGRNGALQGIPAIPTLPGKNQQ